MSAFFTGQHNSGREVSISGVPKKLDLKETIEQMRVAREKRKVAREMDAAACVIQAHFKSFRCRKNQRNILRSLFDSNASETYNEFMFLLRIVPIFYEEELDLKRLTKVGNQLLKFSERVKNDMCKDNSLVRRIIRLMIVCLRDLRVHHINNSMILNILQEFTVTDQPRINEIILKSNLYNKDYYISLHILMCRQISIDQFNTVLDFILHPIVSEFELETSLIGLYYLSNTLLSIKGNENSTFYQKIVKELSQHPLRHKLLLKILDCENIERSLSFIYSILIIYEDSMALIPLPYVLTYFVTISTSIHELSSFLGSESEDSDFFNSDDEDPEPDVVLMQNKCLDVLSSDTFLAGIGSVFNTARGKQLLSLVHIICLLIGKKRLTFLRKDIFFVVFDIKFMRRLWDLWFAAEKNIHDIKSTTIICFLKYQPLTCKEREDLLAPLILFSQMFDNLLYTIHDDEFFEPDCIDKLPFDLNELLVITSFLTDFVVALNEYLLMPAHQSILITYKYAFKNVCKLVRHLYLLDTKRHFCPENSWIKISAEYCDFKFLVYEHFTKEVKPEEEIEKLLVILNKLPFVISYENRLEIFRNVLEASRRREQSDITDIVRFNIRRNFIYEDTFENFTVENVPDPHKGIRVQLYSTLGLAEVGIDGGGVYKEFCEQLILSAFDANRGLFKYTNDNMLYPSPDAKILYPDYLTHYYFLGRFIGKMIYDNVLTSLPLAHFFIAKILTHNHLDLDHLASFDPDYYKNLTDLRFQEADFSSLCLYFTVDYSGVGVNELIELKKGGKDTPVTKDNVISYIHLMADYHLNVKIKKQCDAFKHGIDSVVTLNLISMFTPEELLIVLGGDNQKIDVHDLQSHTKYNGEYNEDHVVIKIFWRVVYSLNAHMIRKLLRFVTSSPRAPLLGFKELDPPFMVQDAGLDGSRLPTSSTCMHILKLPRILDFKSMRTKLIYAIESDSGFELS